MFSDFVHPHAIAANLLGDVNDMAVVRQVNRLTGSPDPRHKVAGSAGAILVKGFKYVIAKEWQDSALLGKLFIGSGAKG